MSNINILDEVALRYTTEEILDILEISSNELVYHFEDEILNTIRDTGEFGEDERLNQTIREAGLAEVEEESN